MLLSLSSDTQPGVTFSFRVWAGCSGVRHLPTRTGAATVPAIADPPPRLGVRHHAHDDGAAGAVGGVQDRGEFVLPHFLGGFNDDHQWLGTGRSPLDDVPDLLLVTAQRLGGRHRHHDLTGFGGPQAPVLLRCQEVNDDPAGRDARRWVGTQVPVHRAAGRQLHDHHGIARHSAASLPVAPSGDQGTAPPRGWPEYPPATTACSCATPTATAWQPSTTAVSRRRPARRRCPWPSRP